MTNKLRKEKVKIEIEDPVGIVEIVETVETVGTVGTVGIVEEVIGVIQIQVQKMIDIGLEVGIEVIEMIGVVQTKVEIKVQETRETIQVQDIPQVCIVTIVK